ncbi:hypothetical protein OG985_12185 [Streptomyces sp. NBC_00289]|uniref:hypothetical protein n=1 Tax=Streptomyces sp. NBC_00289 TaxID=2975703 RepID=UPI003251FBDB
MTVDQLPVQVREFANYLNGLLTRLDQRGGWCAVFWQRDPDGMQACLDGREMPPWDAVEALLQDLAAGYGPTVATAEAGRAGALHSAAVAAHDDRPGGRDALGDRFDVMLREQRYAAERQTELTHLLTSATSQEEADAVRLDLAWARDDHERATRRCAELRSRAAELDRRAAQGQARRKARGPDGGAVRRQDAGPGTGSARSAVRGRDPYDAGTPTLPQQRDAPAAAWTTDRHDHPDRTDHLPATALHATDGYAADGYATSRATDEYATDEYATDAYAAPHAADGYAAAPHAADRYAPAAQAADTDPPSPGADSSAAPQHAPAPAPAPDSAPVTVPKQRKRRRGSARFAGMAEAEAAPAVVPPEAVPLPAPRAATGRGPRGARFAGVPEATELPPQRSEPLDTEARRETAETVATLVRLRRQGRSGEAHALLVEIAYWPAARFPQLAAEMQRAGLGADWATLLWEAASLPADRLVAAADALVAAGRGTDGEQILRQGVARPAAEIGRAVLTLAAEDRHREVGALLDAYVRVRTPEEAARSAEPGPQTLVPLLLEAARGISDERHWDLVHALRVAGFTA